MRYGKYIIIEEREHFAPILFGDLVSHDTFLKCYSKAHIFSAGFFRIDEGIVITFGESISLNISPNDRDAEIIEKLLSGK